MAVLTVTEQQPWRALRLSLADLARSSDTSPRKNLREGFLDKSSDPGDILREIIREMVALL